MMPELNGAGLNTGITARVQSVPPLATRIEDARLLRGRGRYIDDLPTPVRTVHAAIVRSPVAHARIIKVDTAAAMSRRGVIAIYDGKVLAEALAPLPNIVKNAPDYRPLAVDRVRFVGESVAVVLAEDRYIAEDAAALVAVEYDSLPAVVDPVKAVEPGAPLLHEALGTNIAWSRKYRYGDPEAAFAAADCVVSLTLDFPKYNSTPLETYGIVAEYRLETGQYVVHANFQGPFSLIAVMARALRVPEHQLRVIVPEDIGGSFGNKAMIYPYMVLMAACAKLAGLPVKWIEDRSEHLLGSASGTDRHTVVDAAVRNDGRILALRLRMLENVGAYLRAPEPSCVMRSLTTFSGPYRIEHGDIDVACVMTNKLPTGLNRGYGGQQHVFTLERIVDRVAQVLALDPAEIRFRNFIPAAEFPFRTTTGSLYDSGDYRASLIKALDLAKYEAFKAERDQLRRDGRLVGIGIATIIHSAASNIGYVTLSLEAEARAHPNYQAKSGTNDFAELNLDSSGRVRVRIGTACTGQGHATTVTQIVAARLGISPASVDVIDQIDTGTSPWSITSGTYASRFTIAVGGAVASAADKLKAQILTIAGELLEVSPTELDIIDGEIQRRAPSNIRLSLRRVAGAAHWNRGAFTDPSKVQLAVSESYGAPNLGPPDLQDRVNAAASYGFMADLALVEVDAKTCVPRVLKYVAVHDVGNALNPKLIRGQIAGGIVHGVGGALYEHCDYDEHGQMLNASFMEYLCPTAVEAPEMIIDHCDVPSPFTVMGVKGCGENSAMSAPAAVAAAIEDALQPYGAQVTALPLTPAAIWRMMKNGPRAP